MRRIAVCGLVAAMVSVGGLIALAPGLSAAAQAADGTPTAARQDQVPGAEPSATGASHKGSGTAGGAAKDHELIFMDGFESGDTSAWDYEPITCTSVLDIPTNLKD